MTKSRRILPMVCLIFSSGSSCADVRVPRPRLFELLQACQTAAENFSPCWDDLTRGLCVVRHELRRTLLIEAAAHSFGDWNGEITIARRLLLVVLVRFSLGSASISS